MKNYIVMLLTFLIFTNGGVSQGYAEDKPAHAAHIEILDDDVMNKMTALAQPAEQHQLLSSLAGTWDYTLQYWVNESADPQTSSGTMVNEMVLGERYLSEKTGLILNVGGQSIPYEGWGLLGYDSGNKNFTSVWADTMRTGLMSGSGSYNEEQKTIEEKGQFTHPLLTGEQAYRAELQFVDQDIYKRTFFMTGKSGKEFKVLEIELNRRK